jgi:hypothetical protein
MVSIVNGEKENRGTSSYYVSALIENGRATSIVIYDSYNNYKRPDGSKPEATGNVVVAESFTGSKKPTMVGESKITVNAFGAPVVDFTAKVPEWAFGTATLTYDLYVNGTIALAGQVISPALTIDADQEVTVSNKILTIGGALKSSDSVRLEITGATYSDVKVKYVDTDGNNIDSMMTAGTTKTINVGAIGNVANLKLAIDSAKYNGGGTNMIKSITGVTASGETINTATVVAADASEVNAYSTLGTVSVNGDGYVTVEIDTSAVAEKPVTYKFTSTDKAAKPLSGWGVTDADATKTLTIAVTGATTSGDSEVLAGLAPNASVAGTVTLSAAAANDGVHGYRVVCEKLGLDAILADNTPANWAIRMGAADMTISPSDFTVTEVTKLEITDIKWTAGEIRVTFNKAVDATTVNTTNFAGTVASGATLTAAVDPTNKNVVVIKAAAGKDIAAGDKLVIAKAVASGVAGESGITVAIAPNDTSLSTPTDVAVGASGFEATLVAGGTATVTAKA